ncbi:MAG: helix-turn-helix transcriptional regulator, partial [Phenylobacterium sp.]|nr:helix-turn-helix transcriptional regulator [Phenylobacterium sp.]
MKWEDLADQPCSIARSVAVIGDRWTLMILRDAFLGVRRFEAFQTRLGISRTIITERLKLLVEEGVLAKVPYQDRPVRHEYRLTQKGMDLYP